MKRLFIISLLCSSAALAGPPKVIRVAILDTALEGAENSRLKAAIEQALAAEIRKVQGISAISASEVRDLIALERQKELLGCGDDGACMAELADALGSDELISSSVIVLGDSYTVTFKRSDARKAAVTGAFTRQVKRQTGEEVLALIGPAIEEIYAERPLKPGASRGVDQAVSRKLNPPPLRPWVLATTLGLGAVAGGAGAYLGTLAKGSHAAHESLIDEAREQGSEGISYAELQSARERTESQARTANLLFGAAAVLGVAAAVEVFFTDFSPADASTDVRLSLSAGPGGLFVNGAF